VENVAPSSGENPPSRNLLGNLPENLLAFCEILRVKHQFRLGPGEVVDALRALESVGVDTLERARSALRLVCCSRLEDVEAFNAAFNAFFFPASAGVAQTALPPLEPPRRRPNDKRSEKGDQRSDEEAPPEPGEQDVDPEFIGSSVQHTPEDQDERAEPSDKVLRGRFSFEHADSDAPRIAQDGLEPMFLAASQLISSLRLGRSRKWRTVAKGSRFDFRRTLRQSLSTGGDALYPRWKGHPRRNPRIVLLLDGSRSMLEAAGPALQFAFCLSQRSKRVDVFTFSTELRDVTPDLRKLGQGKSTLELPPLKSAWGGGTRIGENLRIFVRDHAARVLTPDTLVIVSSDGLDVGETDVLAFALREIKRRSAGIVWLNPLAAHPAYQPTARGMKAALPFLSALTFARTPEEFAVLAKNLR